MNQADRIRTMNRIEDIERELIGLEQEINDEEDGENWESEIDYLQNEIEILEEEKRNLLMTFPEHTNLKEIE